MKPTIGRIVLYNHPGSKDGTFAPAQSLPGDRLTCGRIPTRLPMQSLA